MADEDGVRLRASCNACNESKVRCSQGKPTCTKCERNQIDCIYGLSRRTHKDAPPINVLASRRGSRRARHGHGRNNNHSSNNLMFHLEPEPERNSAAQSVAQLMDFDPMEYFSAMHMPMSGAEFAKPASSWSVDPFSGTSLNNHNGDVMNIGTFDQQHHRTLDGSDGACTCHAGVAELLSSMMRRDSKGDDQRNALVAPFANLKQCIAASGTSLACVHGREDSEPTHIMAVAILIGHVIEDFKVLANESSLRSPPLSTSMSRMVATAAAADVSFANAGKASRAGVATPNSSTSSNDGMTNMSMGGLLDPALELDEDDEQDLRQRLYLLSFRKLEKLLLQLTNCLRDHHASLGSLVDPSRQLAFVTACDHIRLWLGQKATDVKRMLATPTRWDQQNENPFT